MLFFILSMENLTDENDKGHALVLSDGTPAVFNQAYDLFVIIEWWLNCVAFSFKEGPSLYILCGEDYFYLFIFCKS